MFVKNSILTTIILTTSIIGFAGPVKPLSVPYNTSALPMSRAWEFGIHALYLNPNYSIPAFTQTNSATPAPPSNPSAGTIRIVSNSIDNNANNHWNGGFSIEGIYHFRKNNDLNLNWYHFNDATNQILQRGSGFANFIQDELTTASFFSDVATFLKANWNAVNLEFGQLLNFNEWGTVRFHGGFQYANIQLTSENRAESNNTATESFELANITTSNTTMKYNGFGPRIGLDLFYNINSTLSLYGKAATALLIGSQKFNQSITGIYTLNAMNVFAIPTDHFNLYGSGAKTTIVPELEAKAGGAYTYNMEKSSIIIDAGWMWVTYFNAQGATATPNGVATSPYPTNIQLNFGIQGAYFGLKWLGNMP